MTAVEGRWVAAIEQSKFELALGTTLHWFLKDRLSVDTEGVIQWLVTAEQITGILIPGLTWTAEEEREIRESVTAALSLKGVGRSLKGELYGWPVEVYWFDREHYST